MNINVNEYLNQQVEIYLLGVGKQIGILTKEDDDSICLKVDGKNFKISKKYVLLIHKVDVQTQLNVFMCKNEKIACKGYKFLLPKKKITHKDIQCSCVEECDCDYGCVGSLYDIPPDVRQKVLNGMHTTIPVREV